MHFTRSNKSKFKAAPAPSKRAAQSVPHYLKLIVRTVEELWEKPDPNQYDGAYQDYLIDLQKPIEEIETAIEEKTVLFRCTVERMVEIAPDLFEKALGRSAFETDYFIDKNKENDEEKDEEKDKDHDQ